ncbi:P-loop containing nucleoside triphosphate hydrolase protein [Xylaria palmicola]|nr:P-loop containing nucleoside triphosphate hydrolase protein [Xylaria palmicola]
MGRLGNESRITLVEETEHDASRQPNDQASGPAASWLTDHEQTIIKRQVDLPAVDVKFTSLYRYATRNDLIIIAISIVGAIAGGAATPLMTLILGTFAASFQDILLDKITLAQFNSQLVDYTLRFVYLAIGEFVAIYISTVGFIYTGEHITAKIREEYLAAILRQNIAFFDQLGVGEITTRITTDTNLVQDGISEKIGLILTALSTFIAAFVVGFVKYWKLTLVLSAGVIATFIVMALSSKFFISSTIKSLVAAARGGSIAEEVLSSIRNAVAFGTQEKLAARYKSHLGEAEKWGVKVKIALGCLVGGLLCVQYLSYALSVWLGAKYIVNGETGLSAVITIMLALTLGASTLGTIAPNLQAVTTAVSAATKIFQTIDRASPLDSSSEEGEKLPVVRGDIVLRNVSQVYPSRPDVVVMDNVSVEIPAGKTTAIVGASGSGKSSILGLLERFYEPVRGDIFLDGWNIKDLNIRWLRQQMAMVIQEPVLFATTIRENIGQGLVGTPFENSPNRDELIRQAAILANAHDFISLLPEGYDTEVGQRGGLMSGGQKQRIAIARAIVSDPKILLLDEATSALDTKSEQVVQEALESASKQRTTIVIAHRLSTITKADNIIVMSSGRIIEQGTHKTLMAAGGTYSKLVEAQKLSEKAENTDVVQITDAVFEYGAVQKDALELFKGGENHFELLSMPVVLPSPLDDKERQYSTGALFRMMASFNKEEVVVILLGLVFAVIVGGGNPTQAVFYAKSINALALPPSLYDKLLERTSFWALMYLMLAFVVLIAFVGQGWALSYCSERLIHKARDAAFRAMLRQDISFFDQEKNSPGALTTYLSTETTHLAGLSGSTLGTVLSLVTTLVAALAISLAIGWQLALVCASTIPIVLACGFLRFWILGRFQARARAAYNESASYACEATSTIRTVVSLTREDDVLGRYRAMLQAQLRVSLISVSKSSTLYAASQSVVFLAIALGFWYGGMKIAAKEYTLFQFFVCFSAIIFGSQAAGTVFSFAPDLAKATGSANSLKNLLARKPRIDTQSTEGIKNRPGDVQGKIEFRDVRFTYPTRPEYPVLRGLNFTVHPGQYVALVGGSGCGKSTTIQLLERFYDPTSGEVLLDGINISKYNVNTYRRSLSLVSQEPTLYDGTIRENILLGVPEDTVAESLIREVLIEANLWDFVVSLPAGLDTQVGSKGAMLSGGQKQRIAIARALVREPKVLLLDEATSALDSESEKAVQAALDRAAKGRTTIAIAHRLSSIQKADVIFFLDQGRVVESGSHDELLAIKGRYYDFVKLQSLG